jgi:hypothetical protein
MRLLLAAMLCAAAARAGEPDASASDQPAGLGAIPTQGVEQKPRHGTFAEAALGIFSTLGGSRAFSSAQPYLGMSAGREMGRTAALFVSLGIGASSNSCYQRSAGDAGCAGADSFGATFVELGASYGVPLASRALVSGKLVGGLTLFSPGPFTRKDGAVPEASFAPHAGAGLSVDYATRLDHFAVGLDALARYSFVSRPDGSARAGIASLALMPRIRYVF